MKTTLKKGKINPSEKKKVRIGSRKKKLSALDELMKDKKWKIEHDEKRFRI
jgi:hypothetical protein